jgi:uncharacterized repeat protein (TIGR03803 family)
MNNLRWWKIASVVFLLYGATATGARAQTFTTLADFEGTNGSFPGYGPVVQGIDGNLYGTTGGGGANNEGTVFKLTAGGELTTLYSFCSQMDCTDGLNPLAGLVQATDGNLYGTTYYGGVNTTSCQYGCGTVFKVTPRGALTTLYSFCSQPNCTDGYRPITGLVQATNGKFYGTTGNNGVTYGTVFEITAEGTLTTLHSFCSQANCVDGEYPSGLVQATDGNLYGTTYAGGTSGAGTVFSITTEGKVTTLYSFCARSGCTDGAGPLRGVVQAADGTFYGTTTSGGVPPQLPPGCGALACGTIFQITARGALTTLYSFCFAYNCADGYEPLGLVQAGNKIYGTTGGGGGAYCSGNGCGTLFNVDQRMGLTTLHSFCSQPSCTDGISSGTLFQATNGILYGTTEVGGDPACNSNFPGCGTVFSLATQLGPFVETLPAAAKVGAEVGILGSKLTGATSVTFDGTATQFVVRSPSLILARVPAGATTGKIKVMLPDRALSTNVPFHVMK